MSRGIREERSLARLLWKRGFAVVRATASGASTKMHRPDLVAGSSEKRLQFAVEVKTTSKEVLYVKGESVAQLVEFSKRFGCKPVIAIKFKGRKRPWIFIHPSQLSSTPSLNYKISYEDALRVGMDFKTLVGEGQQMRLHS